jgi:hypothetical protein
MVQGDNLTNFFRGYVGRRHEPHSRFRTVCHCWPPRHWPGRVKGYALRGEILSPPGGSVSQTIAFRYKDIGGILCAKNRKNMLCLFLSKYSLDRNNIIISIIHTQFIPPISL